MNTPKDASDSQIAKLFEDEMTRVEQFAKVLDRIAPLANPEVIFHKAETNVTRAIGKPEIDLRGRDLDVRYEFHGSFRGKQMWSAWNERTYDGTNEIGHGESREDALVDLLDQLGEPEPKPEPRLGRVIHSSRYEPPTIVPGCAEDWERDDNFDTDLEPTNER